MISIIEQSFSSDNLYQECMMVPKMNELSRFDPFNNRLCRDVRNALSKGFNNTVDKREMEPVRRIADFFLDDPQPEHISTYIEKRLAAYEMVLTKIFDRCLEHPLNIAMVIWDHELFFETHEYLEPFWMESDGNMKKLYQAVIRAAGTYVHIEQGNLTGARRIADKALSELMVQKDQLSLYADPQLLLPKLKVLDPVPPKLSETGV